MPLEFTPAEGGLEFTPVGPEPGEFNRLHEAVRAALGAGRELVDIPTASTNLLSWPLRAAAAVPAAVATVPFIRPESAITGGRTSLADAFSEALAAHTETGHIPYLGEKQPGIDPGERVARMEMPEYLIGKTFQAGQQGLKAGVNEVFERGTFPRVLPNIGANNPILATILETLGTGAMYAAPGAVHPVARAVSEAAMPGRAFGKALEADVRSTVLTPDEAIRIGQPEAQKRFEADKVAGPEGDEARAAYRLPLAKAVSEAVARSPYAAQAKPIEPSPVAEHREGGPPVQGDRQGGNLPPDQPAQGDAAGGGDRLQRPAQKPLTYEPYKDLTPEERAIETRAGDYVVNHTDEAVAEYKKRFGNVISTDNARELSADYMNDRTKSVAVHEPFSSLMKEVYRRALEEEAPPGKENAVVFTAGGTGAGKTHAIYANGETKSIAERAQIVYDTNMNRYESAKQKIDQALAAGKRVVDMYVYRDPVMALIGQPGIHGVIDRAIGQQKKYGTGRTVPLSEHAATHVGAREVVERLAEHYKDNPMVSFFSVHNKEPGVKPPLSSLEDFPKLNYEDTYARLKAALEAENATGKIPENIHRAIAREAPRAGTGVREGDRGHGAGEPVRASSDLAMAGVRAAELVKKTSTGRIIGGFGDINAVTGALRRMERLAKQGEAGRPWYKDSADALVEAMGGDRNAADRVAMLIALTSTGHEVKANFTMTSKALEQYARGEPIKVATGETNRKIEDLLYRGVVPDTVKVNDFYRSISQHITGEKSERPVTDRHQFRIASGDEARTIGTRQQYEHTAALTAETAKRLGWPVEEAQAAMWVAKKANDKLADMKASVKESKNSKYAGMPDAQLKKIAMDFGMTSFASEIKARDWKPPEGVKFPPLGELRAQMLGVQHSGGLRDKAAYLLDRLGMDQTQTPEFKRWFGDSKVVDTEGKPLVVYHATDADFTTFEQGEGRHPSSGLGFFFTEDPKTADLFHHEDFVKDRTVPARGSNTMPVFLSIKNPEVMSWGEFKREFVDAAERDDVGTADKASEVVAALVQAGRDGILIKKRTRGAEAGTESGSNNWVAFNPEQIKSATGNKGAFDATKADITEVRSGNQIDKVPSLSKATTPKELPEKVGKLIESGELAPEEKMQMGRALEDLISHGVPEHFLDGVTGFERMTDARGAEMGYMTETRAIPVNQKILNALRNERPYLDMTAAQLPATARGMLLHELMHGIDHDPKTPADAVKLKSFASANSPRLAFEVDRTMGDAFTIPHGDIAKEAYNHWMFKKSPIAKFLSYPFDSGMEAKGNSLELFAQLGRLYHTNPEGMQKHLPVAYDAFKEIFTNAGNDLATTRQAIRETLRTSGPPARDQAAGRRADQARGPQETAERLSAVGETGARMAGVQAAGGKPGKPADDAKSRVERIFGGKPPEPPSSSLPPDGGGAPPLFERQVSTEVTRRVTGLAREFFADHPGKRNRELMISDDVQRYVWKGEIPSPMLAKFGLSKEDFSHALRATVGDAARTMAYYSHVFRDAKLSSEDLAILQKAGIPEDALVVRPWWRRVQDIWRGLLVTQLATAVRNAETQGVKLGLDGMTEMLDSGVQRLLGRKGTVNPLDGFQALFKVFSRNKTAIDKILDFHPSERDRLFANWMSDVSVKPKGIITGAVDAGLSAMESGVQALNVVNRFQEFAIRRGVFQARLDQALRRQGIDLTKLIEQDRLSRIPKAAIEEAVNKAMEATFAETPPYGSIAKLLIDVANKIPGVALAIPFPRFMFNSLKYLYQYSPLGILSYLGPKERAAFAAGNTAAISKAVVGAGLLATAFAFRNSDNAGEKWYEYKTDKGETVDLRPFNPFAAYLFVADVIKKYKDNTLYKLTPQDIAQGILSSNMRAGTGLYILDNFLNNYFGQVGDEKKFLQKVQELGGNLAAGFFTPFAQLRDVYDQFTQGYSEVKDTKEEPILGPIKRQLPVLSQELPSASYPTREGPKRTLDPLLRQLTGIGKQEPKNKFESELDRLGFTSRDVISGAGEPDINQKYNKLMGMLSEKIMVPLTESEVYNRLDDARRGVVLDEMMNAISTEVKKGVNATLPVERQIDLVLKHEPVRIKILLKQAGVMQ